ncbi:hypothetical protein LPJ75_003474, partial [Coemansia sp. RSA 2598]
YQNEPAAAGGLSDDENEDDIMVDPSKGGAGSKDATAMDEDPKHDDGRGKGRDSSVGAESRAEVKSKGDDDNDEDDEDEDDGASEVGRMRDYMRHRAADMAEVTRQQKSRSPTASGASASLGSSDDQGSCLGLAPEEADADASDAGDSAKTQSLPPVPKIPPHPFADMLASMPPPPPIPPHPFAPSSSQSSQSQQVPPPLPKTRPKNPFAEPKGRVQDLFRESKQRSLSSSELDNIVPSDIGACSNSGSAQSAVDSGSADAPGGSAADQPGSDDASAARRGRAGSFAARRQRSRSQSAGVGITREMVIQAASKGQFPYLDAKTCEFVGQLKTDTVTLGGAAAAGSREGASRQRSKTAVGGGNSSGSTSSNSGGVGIGIGIGVGIGIGMGPQSICEKA